MWTKQPTSCHWFSPPKAALQQIRDKQYQQKYLNLGKTVYGIGVDFREKNIGEWLVETYESPPLGEA